MPFNSLGYFLFLPVVYLVFYFIGQRVRWAFLLAASFLFYAALNVPYLPVVLALVVITTYIFGIVLGRATNPKVRLALLWGGIAANVLILAVMKYLPRLSKGMLALLNLFSVHDPIQPIAVFVAIGVSYYVFQAISYLIDVYLETVKPEQHFGYLALSLAFFPKLLQGPIERSGNLLPQLKVKYKFNCENVRSGMLLFAWGLFKKVVIADGLGLYVDAVYNNSNVYGFCGLPLLLATYAYALQIYMDFSGYTDMALGSARLFNINLTQNFNGPYIATSVADFWRRWHISFSSWIRDYIFTPLEMQWRAWKNWGIAVALIITFFAAGLWHGARWGLLVWGLLHGVYLACSVFYKPYQKKLHKALGIENTGFLKIWQIFVTFNLVSFAWIFFRANGVGQAVYVISNVFNGSNGLWSGFLLSQGKSQLVFLLINLLIYLLVVTCMLSKRFVAFFNANSYVRWFVYYAFILLIFFFNQQANKEFIYFKF